ncbi:leucine rich repeat domain containing protein [Grosmannia clavigera kw1407]|uniref:Leucine rich repeat domain containing protein n=1 Tax=Grosmannia clavigera (strain kw1407 / UAMH 11150) TaxID=655863 RepID=F0XD45_GROCL|nr:leucine rich repeat domain containing protein [Grosmannia clavigera kw1407]EFX04454.1 leucine rich repeat domain containing protein [Grosmannia clavigera kw1407]
MSRLLQKRVPSPPLDSGRPSFSSIRERDCDCAQSFTSTKISSYISLNQQGNVQRRQSADEIAVLDDSCSASPARPSSPKVSTSSPSSSPLGAPAFDSSVTWISGGDRYDEESHSCMKGQDSLLDLSTMQLDDPNMNMEVSGLDMEGGADMANTVDMRQPLELLPVELFQFVLEHLIVDIPPNGIDRRNVDLVSLNVTSRSIYGKTLEALYRRVTIPHSRIFQKFLAQIEAYPVRGTWVHRLDFSHLNPISLFSSVSKRYAARNLTSETLLRCLDLTPELHEFLAQDYIDSDLSEDVLRKVFTGLPKLKALDLCGSSSISFRNAFTSLVARPLPTGDWPEYLGIERLSLHKCTSLTPAVFDFLLPKLGNLTHLDVAGTGITDAALHSIPATACLTHLNLAKCSLLTADSVIEFLAHHPAVNHEHGLVFLSLSFDASISEIFGESDVSRLLNIMPESLKSLSLKGSKMSQSHLPQLRILSRHLEELALGRGLTLGDVGALVVPPQSTSADIRGTSGDKAWVQPSLRYIDLTDMTAEIFDLSYLYLDSRLLDPVTAPLEVIEVSEDVFKRVSKSMGPLSRMGWRRSEIGARSWLVRGGVPSGSRPALAVGSFAMENGQRPWKMGAQSWGMRKLPVAHTKVGGMYGSYMFGRKL